MYCQLCSQEIQIAISQNTLLKCSDLIFSNFNPLSLELVVHIDNV